MINMYQAKQCIANAIAAEGQISGAWSMPAAQRATQGILVLPKCLRLEHYTLKKVETTFLCVLFEYGCLSFQSNVFAKEIFANASKLIFVTNVVIFFFSSRSTKFP